MANVTDQNLYNGTIEDDTIGGTSGADTLSGDAGNDLFIGLEGNDTFDGGSGFNTVVYHGSMDAFQLSVNSSGVWSAKDLVTDGLDLTDGSNEGIDALTNIQVVQFLNADGSLNGEVKLDDYSNLSDPSNLTIEYGKLITGRINYYSDVDLLKLNTVAGEKLVLTPTTGSIIISGIPGAGSQYSYNFGSFAPSETGSFDIQISDGGSLSYTNPRAGTSYSFTLRRELDGTDGSDTLNAGDTHEYLSGGLGDDTLNGSVRSDILLGGDGNDILTGSAGNDELDGGAGMANIAVFSGNRSEYGAQWLGSSDLGLKITHLNNGVDGIDTVRNVQILRFADGDVVLDSEANSASSSNPLFKGGQTISGSLPDAGNYQTVDMDYAQYSFATGVTSDTVLRIKVIGDTSSISQEYLSFNLSMSGTTDRLTFIDANNPNQSYIDFSSYVGAGNSGTTWFVKPQYWGSNIDFTPQRADLQVWGYSYGSGNFGVLNGYQITIDRVQLGTVNADTIVGDGVSSYIDGQAGDDTITGSAIGEEIHGGAGNDTLSGGTGDDILVAGEGVDTLNGGVGNDVLDVRKSTTALHDIVDGGDGIDTLRINSNQNLSAMNVSNVEILEGDGGVATYVTPASIAAMGITTVNHLAFGISPTASGAELDVSALAGTINLYGSNQSDRLVGNDQANTIYLQGQDNSGTGSGVDTVIAGGGDDTIVWHTPYTWNNIQTAFSSFDLNTKTYGVSGTIGGGTGSDTLRLDFSTIYWYHPWGGQNNDQNQSQPWKIDFSQLQLSGIEKLEVVGISASQSWAYPSEIYFSVSQLAGLTSAVGMPSIGILGGGSVDIAHLNALGITQWRIADANAYTINGTADAETISFADGLTTVMAGSGNDTVVIDHQPAVSGIIDGGDGTDTLVIRGGDVDLSHASLSNFESISVSSESLSLTQAQWEQLGSSISRASGANTQFILSVTAPGTTTIADNSPYAGLTGSSGDDILVGNAGDNILVGGAGNDRLSGLSGNDRLVSGDGVDALLGGDGNDTLVVSDKSVSTDTYDGGAGLDTLEVSGALDLSNASITGIETLSGTGTVALRADQVAGFSQINGVSVQLTGADTTFNLGNVQLGNGANILLPLADVLIPAGTAGVIGSKGDDVITCGAGNDTLLGGRGSDQLSGGAGNDTLIGGKGIDTLIGGSGDDRFVVEAEEFTRYTTTYGDVMDGGIGNDTLEINFNGSMYGSTYQINSGSMSNVERLVVTNPYVSTVSFDAETWKSLNSFVSESNQDAPYLFASLSINGTNSNISFDNVTSESKIGKIDLTGTFRDIDASNITLGLTNSIDYNTAQNYHSISVANFDTILLSDGADFLQIYGDTNYAVTAGGGDDIIKSTAGMYDHKFTVSIDGGAGNDTFDLSSSGFSDLSGSDLSSIETIAYGTSTLVLTQSQKDSMSFDGSGAIFVRVGNDIVGTTGNDSYNGDGTGSFQGGKGDDSINNVHTAVFSGNYADYDFIRNGGSLTVQQSRGSLADGTDTLNSIMELKFADTVLKIDDAPDSWSLYRDPQLITELTNAQYGKQISAKKDYSSDTDVFSTHFAPNSPLAVESSSSTGGDQSFTFFDAVTGGQIMLNSLVLGYTYSGWSSSLGMNASQKWLPMLNGKPYEGGDVLVQANISGGIQDYAFTLKYLDDYAGSVETLGQMDPLVGQIKGYVGDVADSDWIRTDLIAGTRYEFNLKGLSSGNGSLVDPKLQLLDSEGRVVENGVDIVGNNVGNDDMIVFRPTVSGNYYLAVSDVGGFNTGSWTLTQKSLDMIAGNVSTTERIEWSNAQTFEVSSEINALSDHDWFKVWLDHGLTYNFRGQGTSSSGGTLADPQISLRSASGVLLAQDDNSGGGSDAKLVYSATDSGWYFLDMGASGNTGKGTYTIKGSTLADDYANTILTTGVVQQGTPTQGLITYNGDSDWFKVGLSHGTTYVIDLKGDISASAQLDPLKDPLLIIRDATGREIYKADDFGTGLDARAYFTPTADGVYYLEAKSAFKYDIGAYELSVALAPADDFVGSVADALSNPAKTGALTLGDTMSGTIGIPGDHDMFSASMEAGKVYQITASGIGAHAGTLVDPYIRVFDAQGHLLDFDNDSGVGSDAQMYFAPSVTGTYYFEASSNNDRGMGSYQISAVLRNTPADDVPNDMSTQVTLSPGDSFAGTLLTHNDQDWFGINLLANKDYVFRVRAEDSGNGSLHDPVLEIHAADGSLIRTIDNTLISSEPAALFTPIANGTYYLVVKAANGMTDTGTYTLTTRAPDDYSDTQSSATSLQLDQTLDGAIQWSFGNYGVRAYDSVGLANDADEDWFTFHANANDVLSINVSLATDSALSRPMVEIVDSMGRIVGLGDGLETGDGSAVATFKATSSGSYYARVIDGAGATGAYKISLSAGDASDEDSSGAVTLHFDGSQDLSVAQVNARIGLAGDTDGFSVSLESGHNYRFETLAVRDGSHAPLSSASLTLDYLETGASVSQHVDIAHTTAEPSFFDSTLFTASSSGTMSVIVQPLDDTQTGQYKLRVVDLGVQLTDDRPDQVADYQDATHGIVAINENVSGKIDSSVDKDLYAVNLTTGNIYNFSLKGYADGLGTLAQGNLQLLNSLGELVTVGHYDAQSGRNELDVSIFQDGRYYLSVSAADVPGNQGTYLLETRTLGSDVNLVDDITADTRSGVTVLPGHPVTGRIDYSGDSDWINADLEAGKVYVIDVLANGDGAGGTLKDSVLRMYDSSGNEIALDDNSGAGLDSHIQFTPNSTETYYFDVSGNATETGTYELRVRELYSGAADPLKSAQWYLSSLGLDKLQNQITGAGVTIGMIDDGIDTAHPDLQNQIDFADSFDTVYDTQVGTHKINLPTPIGDGHGTAVAGLMVGEQNNETGIVGVAPDANIASLRVNWSWDQITQALQQQYKFDISNNSWGAINPFGDNFNSTTLTFAYEALRTGVEDGRDGKGTVFVFSAGNSAASGDNTNYHNFQNAREVITVAAANQDGTVAGFSTPGASILVGTYGVDLLTTDRHEAGLGYNPTSNYTSFSGTSAAAPLVSGIVALMLEANPNLGYRDIQNILVYSSTHPDNQTWKSNGASTFNLDGLKYNDQMGFGLVDAYSAVSLAKTWNETSTSINEVVASARAFGLSEVIPDGDGTAFTKTFHIDSTLNVEHVELGIDLRHTRLGDLVVELISPDGTVSTLMNRPTVNAEQPFGLSGTDSGVPTHLVWDFSSVQFWGEAATGDWTVRIQDVRAEETGILNSLSLRVYGARDDGNDIYVFTEEGFQTQTTRVLSDESGIDTINAAPMLHDMYVNLSEYLIAAEGVTYSIAPWTILENIITGSGDDRAVGNDSSNLINTGLGDDILEGGQGNDTLNGGAGHDTVRYQGLMSEYSVSWNPISKEVTVVDNKVSGGDDGTDTLSNIERIVFIDGEMSLSNTVGNHAPTVNSSIFANPVLVTKGMGIQYDLPANAFSDADSSNGENLEISVNMASGSELPEWLTYNPETRTFEGVPPVDMQGQLQLLVTAVDEFGTSVSDILTLQFGDNQAPILDLPKEKVLSEDAGLVLLDITKPVDPEGKDVSVKILEIPTVGLVFDKAGNSVIAGTVLSADALTELHYETSADTNGSAGYLRYQAIDADGVTSESSIHLYVDAINDAPRFATPQSKLIIEYPSQSTVNLDMNHPFDPESTINAVRLIGLPTLGVVTLNGEVVVVNQMLTMTQLDQLQFTLNENVNGPIGGVTIQAVDPEGLATDWTLNFEVHGAAYSNTGTAGNDSMYGSIGADTLYGMGGNDTLVGNAGNDRLLGGLGNDTLFGGSGNDSLDGSSGNDYLDGGTGNDNMSGGPGNDTYIVDSVSDIVLEIISGGAGGKDLIVTSVSLTAPANVENLQASMGAVVDLTGNDLDNVLVGNELANILLGNNGRDTLIGGAGNDTLDGGLGIDRLVAGVGDDLYRVDSRMDVAIELIGEGTDTVRATCSYTLSSNIENLILEEGGDYTAGGNSLNNHLYGNSGNNILAGGLGADVLEGGLGNDIYVLSDNLDTIIDTGGIDTIRSTQDITLMSGIENAELVGIGDTAAIGNGLNNILIGNQGNNILEGLGGVDTLTGGDGDDQFVISYNSFGVGTDVVTDLNSGSDLLIIDLGSFGIDPTQFGLLSSGLVDSNSFVKGAGAIALDSNDYFIFDTAQGMLMLDPDGNGSMVSFGLVDLGGISNSLSANNIYVVI